MKKRTKIISVFLATSMVLLAGCAQVQLNMDEGASTKDPVKETHIYEIEKKTMPMYMQTNDEKIDVELVFLDGIADVPYVSVEGFKYIYETLLESSKNPDLAVSIEEDGETVTLTRDTGYPARILFDEDSIEFYDLDGFFRMTDDVPLVDSIDYPYFNEKGEPQFFEITDSFERYGQAVIVNAGDYGIDLVHQDGGCYIPLHLVSDIFLTPYKLGFIYNGSAVYAGGGGDFDGFDDLFYNKDYPEMRSRELAEFNYNELCLALDYTYGLRSQHDIKDFDTLYLQTGLKDQMLSEDPIESCQALYESIDVYLDDLHSTFLKNIYVKDNDVQRKHTGGETMEQFASVMGVLTAFVKMILNLAAMFVAIGNISG